MAEEGLAAAAAFVEVGVDKPLAFPAVPVGTAVGVGYRAVRRHFLPCWRAYEQAMAAAEEVAARGRVLAGMT